ncbi:MAG: hypothetical protein KDJ38_00925 [Gammaproteobacteria bacterium]|nr:hypothetical protein [Gammaproteobacteria bacterium]
MLNRRGLRTGTECAAESIVPLPVLGPGGSPDICCQHISIGLPRKASGLNENATQQQPVSACGIVFFYFLSASDALFRQAEKTTGSRIE